MTSPIAPGITLTRALEELASHAGAVHVRVVRPDGDVIEGQLLEMDASSLRIIRADDHRAVQVPHADIGVLEISRASLRREWLAAAFAIIGTDVLLGAFSTVPRVKPGTFEIVVAFLILFWAGSASLSYLRARTKLREWLSEWRQLYPPSGP